MQRRAWFTQKSPLGWFRNVLCYVIDFDKGTTIIFNQCFAYMDNGRYLGSVWNYEPVPKDVSNSN